MSRREKLLAQIARNPAGNWRIEDFEALAIYHGCVVRRSGGSHVVIRSPAGLMITVPARRPIKPNYAKKLIEFLEASGVAAKKDR